MSSIALVSILSEMLPPNIKVTSSVIQIPGWHPAGLSCLMEREISSALVGNLPRDGVSIKTPVGKIVLRSIPPGLDPFFTYWCSYSALQCLLF